jgi:3' terminal RNA ribose 2'-O-methyltransferase Hen1
VLLTISTTHRPATDLGYLLYKNPGAVQTFSLAYGPAHVFYPEAREDRCTAALLVDVDPVGLVRGRRGEPGRGRTLDQYVNDRPYAASSLLSVAIAQVFGTALSGKSRERPELATTAIPLEARIASLPCRAGEDLIRRLFEPLGYRLEASSSLLDKSFPEWGQSPYFDVTLARECTLKELLTHLYVLIPVLDNEKHYWVGDDEVEKLLRHGAGWLGAHPERDLITARYLKYQRHLLDDALSQLGTDEGEDADEAGSAHAAEEEAIERPLSLNQQRIGTVLSTLRACGAHRVLDLGCGEGRLIRELLRDPQFTEIIGMDVSHRSIQIATERLRFDRMPERQRERVRLIQGSLMYRDSRLAGFDAAAVVEVIEHMDPPRLAAFERVLFEFAKPACAVITTPNSEYNVRWETLPAGHFRHRDHRFEWTRTQFEEWAGRTAGRFGYAVRFLPIGPVDAEVGPPTQMGVFTRG